MLLGKYCDIINNWPQQIQQAYSCLVCCVRASDWKLDAPDWIGRLKLINKGDKCFIRLEDKTSGQEYAKCPIDKYPGIAIEPVSDSSRYFVIRVQDDNGRAAFIGIGFADRGDSFDLNVALQDHFK